MFATNQPAKINKMVQEQTSPGMGETPTEIVWLTLSQICTKIKAPTCPRQAPYIHVRSNGRIVYFLFPLSTSMLLFRYPRILSSVKRRRPAMTIGFVAFFVAILTGSTGLLFNFGHRYLTPLLICRYFRNAVKVCA